MTVWNVTVVNGQHTVNQDELAMWARAGKISGETPLTDERGVSWRAKDIPGLYSRRDWLAALLLSVFVGTLGIDRFYLGKVGTGILKLLTFGGLTIWTVIDIILIALKKLDDKEGLPLA